MKKRTATRKKWNVGFVSTRLSGTDGVSLETAKWAAVFEKEGLNCFYMAGDLDRPAAQSFLVEKAHFEHPAILKIQRSCFGVTKRELSTTESIHRVKRELKKRTYEFVQRFRIDLMVTENALSIPVNIPLGLALTEFIAETGFLTIGHHHDFFWERKRFLTNAVWDYLNMSFPPHLPCIHHVVINSSADNQLSLRTGISPLLIPNVMDFDNPPSASDEYSADIRKALGIEEDELFVLQPTRIVQRKGIEHAIELVRRLDMKAKLVISHSAGDEGPDYERRVKIYSDIMGVNTVFAADIIGEKRGKTEDGRKIYTLQDIYPHADLITYPSDFEGFGNAFLEAVYFRKPIVVNCYSVYLTDIRPKGFKVVTLPGYVTDEAVRETRELLENHSKTKRMVENNYELGRKYYSYSVLDRKLRNLFYDCIGA